MTIGRHKYFEPVLLVCVIGIVTFTARSGAADTRRAGGLVAWYSFRESEGRDIRRTLERIIREKQQK